MVAHDPGCFLARVIFTDFVTAMRIRQTYLLPRARISLNRLSAHNNDTLRNQFVWLPLRADHVLFLGIAAVSHSEAVDSNRHAAINCFAGPLNFQELKVFCRSRGI